jgi:hypothetical protein
MEINLKPHMVVINQAQQHLALGLWVHRHQILLLQDQQTATTAALQQHHLLHLYRLHLLIHQ